MKIFLLVIAHLHLTLYSGMAQQILSEKLSSEIDEYVTYTMKEQKIPGLALAILEDGKVLKKSAYGLASIEFQVPVSDSSTFWLASVSKHITATAIMQLYEKGILNLDVSIQNYLPDIPKGWKEITIRHLLTHTSGLPVSGEGNERGFRSAMGTLSADQMYENAKKDTLSFAPGERFLYSDEGYFLLGYIIHKVSGIHYREYMENRIFKPSAMNTAYLMDQFKIHPNQVSGYSKRKGELIPDRNSWRLIDTEINAAGGIFASINDMIAWEGAMTSEAIISEDSKKKMWSTATLNNGCETSYGFAWNTQIVKGEKILYHPGIAGTEYLRFVDRNLTIIVLTNQAKIWHSLALAIAKYFGVSSTIPESDFITGQIISSTFNNREILRLIGQYEFISNKNFYLDEGFKYKMAIENENNELYIIYPVENRYRIRSRLVKLKNGRLAELSWYPVFLEHTYNISRENNDEFNLELYENYGCEEDIYIGLLKINNSDK